MRSQKGWGSYLVLYYVLKDAEPHLAHSVVTIKPSFTGTKAVVAWSSYPPLLKVKFSSYRPEQAVGDPVG